MTEEDDVLARLCLYQEGKDIVFRFTIEYSSSSRGLFDTLDNNNNNNRSIFCLRIFGKMIILTCVET
jgi:hypothetical protein